MGQLTLGNSKAIFDAVYLFLISEALIANQIYLFLHILNIIAMDDSVYTKQKNDFNMIFFFFFPTDLMSQQF